MAALYVIEGIALLLFALVIGTQVIVPLAAGTPLFPAFRRRTRVVSEKLAQAREERDISHLKKQISALQDEISQDFIESKQTWTPPPITPNPKEKKNGEN